MEDKLAPKKPSKLLTDYYGSLFGVMVLLFLAATFLVLKPLLDQVKTTNAEISSTLQSLQGERDYLSSLQQSIDAAQTIAPNVLSRVDQALPRNQNIPQLLVLLSQTASRDGIMIPNVSFANATGQGAVSATSSVGELDITMTAVAQDYPHIKMFIHDLEVSLRLLDITGINVAASTEAGKSSAYSLQMKTYIYLPSQNIVATPQQR